MTPKVTINPVIPRRHSSWMALAAISLALSAWASPIWAQADAGAAEVRSAYNEKIAAKYHYAFGRDQKAAFLPSNAATDTGAFIDPKSFLTAQYCGHCHQEAHAEWRQSAHSNSNRVPYYLRNVNLLRRLPRSHRFGQRRAYGGFAAYATLRPGWRNLHGLPRNPVRRYPRNRQLRHGRAGGNAR
jgi:hypothetical protein